MNQLAISLIGLAVYAFYYLILSELEINPGIKKILIWLYCAGWGFIVGAFL